MRSKTISIFVSLIIIMVAASACASNTPASEPPSSTPAATQPAPTSIPAAPTPTQIAASPDSIAVSLHPYPYTTPLPPPTPTILDGVYTRSVHFEGTPTPCRRCAPYRAEGGVWTLKLEAGAFRVSHDATNFHGIGSFTLSGDKLALFNDPNCHLETGTYRWELDGRSLILKVDDDTCGFGLRAKNLGAGTWVKQGDEEGTAIDHCQPPSLEAAISGHWPTPQGC
ncbi:MAG: hypothetical protein KDJ52_12400 [Anaerolineae bacterium]|nr:hypothetical protein [Anaerolineae bacterium]